MRPTTPGGTGSTTRSSSRRRGVSRASATGCGERLRSVRTSPIDVLDLGCGTGRYFAALRRTSTRSSVSMRRARCWPKRAHPLDADHITAKTIELVEGRCADARLRRRRVSISSTRSACSPSTCRFDGRIVDNVARWLRPGGDSRSRRCIPTPRRFRRRWPTLGPARVAAAVTPAPLRRWLRTRLTAGGPVRGRGADSRTARIALRDRIARRGFESEAHLHCLCVARKGKAGRR